jgi:betaine-homocysteine S-methyltransferase
MSKRLGLMDRLADGPVICAEGYLFELERRGYVSAGAFVPVVVLEHPEAIEQLHREFLRAGSDIIEAFTYYAHREKLRVIGREESLEELNRQALSIARKVADEGEALVAGNVCNTNAWDPSDEASKKACRGMFEEQVQWASAAGVDLVIGETFSYLGEALAALEVIKAAKLPAVVTISIHQDLETWDGVEPTDALRQLEQGGADVVGFNCMRGPDTLLPLLKDARDAVSCPLAALPVPYRTTSEQPTFQALRDPGCSCLPQDMAFPVALDPFTCNRYEIAEFTKNAASIGVNYFGLCCGGAPHHVRSMAEALGRKPPASQFSPDMSKHAYFGDGQSELNQEHSKKL